jgi:copper ion binding protein
MTKLRVPDMTCGHCKMTVTKALAGLEGVSTVDVDLATKDVRVTHDARVGLAEIKQAVEAAGYTVA